MKVTATILLMLFCVVALTACSSIMQRKTEIPPVGQTNPRYLYPGVQYDAVGMAFFVSDDSAEAKGFALIYLPMLLLDLPFSAALDTVFLPYDVCRMGIGGVNRSGQDRKYASLIAVWTSDQGNVLPYVSPPAGFTISPYRAQGIAEEKYGMKKVIQHIYADTTNYYIVNGFPRSTLSKAFSEGVKVDGNTGECTGIENKVDQGKKNGLSRVAEKPK